MIFREGATQLVLPVTTSPDGYAATYRIAMTISSQENNALYLKPTSGEFRTVQVGFRLTF